MNMNTPILNTLAHKSLQNKSDWDKDKPTIVITPADPQWENAYKNWLSGKNPTDDPAWKLGVYMTFKDKE
jgi:hypothetical protein